MGKKTHGLTGGIDVSRYFSRWAAKTLHHNLGLFLSNMPHDSDLTFRTQVVRRIKGLVLAKCSMNAMRVALWIFAYSGEGLASGEGLSECGIRMDKQKCHK
jgi:hypothetical protein